MIPGSVDSRTVKDHIGTIAPWNYGDLHIPGFDLSPKPSESDAPRRTVVEIVGQEMAVCSETRDVALKSHFQKKIGHTHEGIRG